MGESPNGISLEKERPNPRAAIAWKLWLRPLSLNGLGTERSGNHRPKTLSAPRTAQGEKGSRASQVLLAGAIMSGATRLLALREKISGIRSQLYELNADIKDIWFEGEEGIENIAEDIWYAIEMICDDLTALEPEEDA